MIRFFFQIARRKEVLECVAAECKKNGASEVLTLVKDLSNLDKNEESVEETIAHFGSNLVFLGPGIKWEMHFLKKPNIF